MFTCDLKIVLHNSLFCIKTSWMYSCLRNGEPFVFEFSFHLSSIGSFISVRCILHSKPVLILIHRLKMSSKSYIFSECHKQKLYYSSWSSYYRAFIYVQMTATFYGALTNNLPCRLWNSVCLALHRSSHLILLTVLV